MVRFGRSHIADIRCNLTYQFLIKATYKDMAGFLVHIEGNTGGGSISTGCE